jgi:hypothetical protein
MADLTETVVALQAENSALRRIYDDERSHVSALRQTVKQLQEELGRLELDRDARRSRRSDAGRPALSRRVVGWSLLGMAGGVAAYHLARRPQTLPPSLRRE